MEQVNQVINCPHCGDAISKSYAIKSLAMLAKSEGIDIGEDLEQFIIGDIEKGGKKRKKKKNMGLAVETNKVDSNRGASPGSFLSSSRTSSGQAVQRQSMPTNPTTEKSLRLPVIDGEPPLVHYSHGTDVGVAKSIKEGNVHLAPARNFRAEREDYLTNNVTE